MQKLLNKKGSTFIDSTIALMILGSLVILVTTYIPIIKLKTQMSVQNLAMNMATISILEEYQYELSMSGTISELESQITTVLDKSKYITNIEFTSVDDGVNTQYIAKYKTVNAKTKSYFIEGRTILTRSVT